MKKHIIFFILAIFFVVIAVVAVYFVFPSKGDFSYPNKPDLIPQYATSYSVSRAVCATTKEICDTVEFTFNALENAMRKTPDYEIRDFSQEGRTEIVFHKIGAVETQFDYTKMTESPAIDELQYEQVEKDLVVNVYRKGEIMPAETTAGETTVKIYFPADTQQNFVFSNEEPQNNSTVYPAKQSISLEIELKEPLKETLVYFGTNPIEAKIADLENKNADSGNESYKYSVSFEGTLENEQQHKIRVIATDEKGRIGVAAWNFESQKKAKSAKLPGDRFKYLGWWGEINANNVAIYEEPTTRSKQLGVFSTASRIKVLEEVPGESIKRNSLWYRIDGGAHPGAYVFSSYLISIVQPEPPSKVNIPEGVKEGEYWVDVDLAKKVLTLFQYDKAVFATYVAIGRPGNPTLAGTYRVWYKLEKTRMKGGPPRVPYRYDLPNVPYVMYYFGSYALHGTYWHDKFGTRQSAGCTNLTQGDAKHLFAFLNPKLPEGQTSVRSAPDNLGTVVYNHY